MTDKELIQALRICPHIGHCADCPVNDSCGEHDPHETAANRLETLIAENELLYREVAQLKAECDHFRDLTKKLWCEKQYGEAMNVPGKKVPSKYESMRGMTADQWNAYGGAPIYCGDLPCWMTHDEEPPSTEEVE